jgi:uncharacterized membrane protein
MIRWLLWIVGGLVMGGIVHLATIMVLPRTATRDAYARLAPLAPVNGFAVLPAPTPEASSVPFMDPAFATAVCRYDLANGPVKLAVPVSQAYTSVTFYTRYDVPVRHQRPRRRTAVDRARPDDDRAARRLAGRR